MRRWLSAVIVLVAACGGGDDDGIDIGAYDTEVTWQPCPLRTGGSDANAACAIARIPLDWRNPGGPTIDSFVKRIGDPAVAGPQLWFLQGGPGGAGSGYEALAELFIANDDSLDIYLLDHRGTGRSTFLTCSRAEAASSPQGRTITVDEYPDCIAELDTLWGADLQHFTTTAAAADLGWWIGKTRGDGQAVHVQGTSYGTRWTQRYLQLFPDQPTSASVLGIVPPDFDFADYDAQYETVGRELMRRCAADSFCAGKLGDDPDGVLRAAMNDLAGTCPAALAAGVTRDRLRRAFASYLIAAWAERAAIPAVAYRLDRCSAADVDALVAFVDGAPDFAGAVRGDPLFSQIINIHISLSEMWDEPWPTLDEAEAAVAAQIYSFGSTRRFAVADLWPRYPRDEYAGKFATSQVPMLLLEGDLDPASPLAGADRVGAAMTAPNQTYVVIPDGTHAFTSPMASGGDCALNQFWQFIHDPTAPIFDCVGDIVPFSFRGEGLGPLFGTADPWD